jgi:hypothetical protein
MNGKTAWMTADPAHEPIPVETVPRRATGAGPEEDISRYVVKI